MIELFPAIDIKDGQAVRLVKGDYLTAHKVAECPVETAKSFKAAGAKWLHMVDLDGAKEKRPINQEIILKSAKESGLKTEVGGGIRDMATIESYLEGGVARVILGSAALSNPELVREAVKKYGDRIAVGIDARNEMVAAEGWLETSDINYIDLAKKMESIGVKTIIFTDISKDGTLKGPNFDQLVKINNAVSCDIIASGGVSCKEDLEKLRDLFIYGVICGKALYSGALDINDALAVSTSSPDLSRFFKKDSLIPAIVQEASTGDVLMLAYMNEQSMKLTLETGNTWFWSRSRGELWNKGATSGHYQKVVSISSDCDDDTLLVKVVQTGAACHTGEHSCFFSRIVK